MFSDIIKIKGDVNFKIYDSNGKIKIDETVKNLVVDSGKIWIASRMAGSQPDLMSQLAIGSNTTIPSALDTGLSNEIARANITETIHSNNMVTYKATFNPGIGTGAITEAGIFNSNVMLCRTTFGVKNKEADDGMVITWTITIV